MWCEFGANLVQHLMIQPHIRLCSEFSVLLRFRGKTVHILPSQKQSHHLRRHGVPLTMVAVNST